jgi:MoxR-like ATPase
MNGMAGTGKTTIAYSLCDALHSACRLGASFFRSRLLPSYRDITRIFPTLAYQLARFSPPFRSELCEVLGSDPDIGSCSTDEQFNKLIKAPLLAVKDEVAEDIVVVIDGLDE